MNSRLLSAVRIATGLLFFQHGAEKLWGFTGGQMDHHFLTLHGFAGPLEVIGGTLIIFGLFTRLAAFILAGQMAVAYFDQWAGLGFFPISNGGEEAVIFCFTYLCLVTAGPGPWAIDRWIAWEKTWARMLNPWEPWGRAFARVILAFLFSLHGYRHVFATQWRNSHSGFARCSSDWASAIAQHGIAGMKLGRDSAPGSVKRRPAFRAGRGWVERDDLDGRHHSDPRLTRRRLRRRRPRPPAASAGA